MRTLLFSMILCTCVIVKAAVDQEESLKPFLTWRRSLWLLWVCWLKQGETTHQGRGAVLLLNIDRSFGRGGVLESETAMPYRTKHHVLVLVYHGTERFPVNPPQRTTQGVEPNRPQHQKSSPACSTLGPCGGYGHKLVARHACAHYRARQRRKL